MLLTDSFHYLPGCFFPHLNSTLCIALFKRSNGNIAEAGTSFGGENDEKALEEMCAALPAGEAKNKALQRENLPSTKSLRLSRRERDPEQNLSSSKQL